MAFLTPFPTRLSRVIRQPCSRRRVLYFIEYVVSTEITAEARSLAFDGIMTTTSLPGSRVPLLERAEVTAEVVALIRSDCSPIAVSYPTSSRRSQCSRTTSEHHCIAQAADGRGPATRLVQGTRCKLHRARPRSSFAAPGGQENRSKVADPSCTMLSAWPMRLRITQGSLRAMNSNLPSAEMDPLSAEIYREMQEMCPGR
jgi:hypothetical protein